MRSLLIVLNLLLLAAIVFVTYFWQPEFPEAPLPGTHAARIGQAAPAELPPMTVGTTPGIVVRDVFVVPMPPGITTTAAYLKLSNAGPQDMRLVAVMTPVAANAELHTHASEGGVMRMRRVAEIVVPAGGETTLAPGGLHVMLFGLKQTLTAGDQVALTLVFADGSRLAAEAMVRPAIP